jgi:hypothetical protein
MICGYNNGQHMNVIRYATKKKFVFIVCSNCSSFIKRLGRFAIVNVFEFVENLMKQMVSFVFPNNGSNLQIPLESA